MEKIAIIGGGPAGYVAAITAAQEGRPVVLIEKQALGGTCLNEGCMPTKALLESATRYDHFRHAHQYGIKVKEGSVEVDWAAVQQFKHNVTKSLIQGIGFLMKKNKIQVVEGEAEFVNNRKVLVRNQSEVQEIEADKWIIATGSEVMELPFAPFDNQWIIDSTQALQLPQIPSTLLIVGGGVIGCEFASIYSRLGTRVIVVELADQLLPGEDPDIVLPLVKELKNAGVELYVASELLNIDKTKKQVEIKTKKETLKIQVDKVLVAVGRKPRVHGLQLENIGVAYTEKQGIQVNEHMQTNVSNIYACGDVIGGIQLAHVAFHEGKTAALNACDKEEHVNYRAVPRCIYTSPEIASVGLNEAQAKERYGDVRIGEFSFRANGKAMIHGEQDGKVKVILEPEYNEIVGLSIISTHATELIGQGTVMIHGEMTSDSLEGLISAHPTLSEAIHEAILSTVGKAIHV